MSLYEEGEEDLRHRDGGGSSYVKAEEVDVMLLQTREHLASPTAGGGEEGYFLKAFGQAVAL